MHSSLLLTQSPIFLLGLLVLGATGRRHANTVIVKKRCHSSFWNLRVIRLKCYGFHWLTKGLEELQSSKQITPPAVPVAPASTNGLVSKRPFAGIGAPPPVRRFLLHFPDSSGLT